MFDFFVKLLDHVDIEKTPLPLLDGYWQEKEELPILGEYPVI